MPKTRTPLDLDRYQRLKDQGLSQRQIAQELRIPESTLRDNLRTVPQTPTAQGVPMVDVRGHVDEPAREHAPRQGVPGVAQGIPQATTSIDQGLPRRVPDVDQETTHSRPRTTQGPPSEQLIPQDVQDLQSLLAWWRSRAHLLQEAKGPDRELVRQTYHIEQRFIDAVRREADLTGESYAAIVNRAFAQYFGGKYT